jgi:heme exporter protein B
MNLFTQAFAVARKDLAIELRTKESLNAAGSFAVVILVIFSFAFESFSDEMKEFGGGLLWLVFAFAGALVFNRGFARELPNECLDTLLASPLSGAALIIGKAFANFTMLLVVELVSLFTFGIFYNVNWLSEAGSLTIVFALATWGVSILGAIFGALTVNLRLRELMLPVIIYPLMVPILIAAIELTNEVLNHRPISAQMQWIRVLVASDIGFTGLAWMLADTILVN